MKNPKRLLTIIILITLLLRLPTLFEPHWFFDEGIYATVGSQWFQGKKLYSEIWDHKPPGIFLIYGLSHLAENASGLDILFWAKLFACLAVALTQLALYKISRILYNKHKPTRPDTWFFLIPPLLYGLLTSLPFWEGYMANGEIFMNTLTTWGLYFLFLTTLRKEPQQKNHALTLISGILLGSAVLIKPVATAELTLATLLLTATSPNIKRALRKNFVFLSAVSMPLLAVIVASLISGSFPDFIGANVAYNYLYATDNKLGLEQDLILSIVRLTALFLSLPILKSRRSLTVILTSWLSLNILTTTLSLRPYIHYLIQLFPPLCLLAPLCFNAGIRGHQKPTRLQNLLPPRVLFYGLLFFLTLIPINQEIGFSSAIPYQFDQPSYYSNFVKTATKKQSTTSYLKFFNNNVPLNQKIIRSLKTNKSKYTQVPTPKKGENRVFIWGGGEAPWLYYSLGQIDFQPATKYTNYFHVKSNPQGFQETITTLHQHSPDLLVIFPSAPPFPELEKLIDNLYVKSLEIEEVGIYKQKR